MRRILIGSLRAALLGSLQILTASCSSGDNSGPSHVSIGKAGVVSAHNASADVSRLDTTPPVGPSAVAPSKGGVSDATYAQAALTFVAQNASRYGFATGASEFELLSIKRSLLGVHVTLQEKISGVPVADSTFSVSFAKASGNVYRVYTTVHPHELVSASKSNITEEAAYDLAWNHLGVTGKLLALPRATLTYVRDQVGWDRLTLVYRIELPVSAPSGSWQVDVDAASGAVLGSREMSIPRYKTANPLPAIGEPIGPIANRDAAFAEIIELEAARKVEASTSSATKTTVNGVGLAFDPDPMTTLVSTTLSDSSPASTFDPAYVGVSLLDITLDNGVYKLEGPWAKIVNWEAPNTAPSTTTNGNWTAKRGNNAFNDVMTYFHIDRNQRYIQSLGFTGIQDAPMELDSDGLNGSDNSHFMAPNRISYGHGGVDDNEDADVILHEYGHAIMYAINNSWNQYTGDEGAMGEGFGDYWGTSDNVDGFPASFDNAKVYTWDANDVDGYWEGRRVDKTNIIYDPTRTYGPHASVPGGVSDELWSTPLFQSLLALRAAAVPKSELDTIILEAHYGFGAGATMRQMAIAMVDTAKRLYPAGPHAGILSTQFFNQNILEATDWGQFAALVIVIAPQ